MNGKSKMEQEISEQSAGISAPDPTALTSYRHAWDQMWKYPLQLLAIIVVLWLFHVPFGRGYHEGGFFGGLTKFTFSAFVLWPINFGFVYAGLRAARGELVIKDIFRGFNNFLNVILANFFVMLAIGIGFIFLIVPGIFIACKLAFTPYLVVDRNMDVFGAMKESWRMTTGHVLQIFYMALLAVPVFLVGLMIIVIGTIPAIALIGVAFGSMFFAVSAKEQSAAT